MSVVRNPRRRTGRSRRLRPYNIRTENGPLISNRLFATSFPREMKVRMRYNHLANYSTTVSVANDHVFNLNSIFDPDRTGVGHQPQGRDQWADFYDRYRVDRVSVELWGTTNTTLGMVFAIMPTNNPSGITDYNNMSEGNRALTALTTYASPSAHLKATWNLHTITGVPKSEYTSDDRYQSLMTTSPTETICLHVATYETALGSVVASYTLNIEYYVTLFDPVQIASS